MELEVLRCQKKGVFGSNAHKESNKMSSEICSLDLETRRWANREREDRLN